MTTTLIDTDLPAPMATDTSPSDRFASRGARLGAAIIDAIINAAAIFLVGALVMGSLGAFFHYVQMSGPLGKLGLALFGGLVYLLMHGYLLAKRGQTIGKRLLGIRIVRSDGSPAGLQRLLLLRWLPVALASMLPLVGDWMGLADALFIFRKSHQCLHDQIADTIVIRTSVLS